MKLTKIPTAGELLSGLTNSKSDNNIVCELIKITKHHIHQWKLEDKSRHADCDAEIGKIKREIDEANAVRYQIIRSIDQMLRDDLPESSLPPVCIGLGEFLDKISISWVRKSKTGTHYRSCISYTQSN